MVVVADGTELAAQKLERVLTTDPGMGVVRHVDAGYERAIEVARERGVRIPMLDGLDRDRAAPVAGGRRGLGRSGSHEGADRGEEDRQEREAAADRAHPERRVQPDLSRGCPRS